MNLIEAGKFKDYSGNKLKSILRNIGTTSFEYTVPRMQVSEKNWQFGWGYKDIKLKNTIKNLSRTLII